MTLFPLFNRPYRLLFMVATAYGLFYIIGKLVVMQMTPLQMTSVRVLFATPILFLVERLLFRAKIRGWDWLKIALLGLMGVGLVQSTIAIGLKYTSIFHVGLILGMSPMVAMALAIALKQEQFSINKLIGSILALGGLYFLLAVKHGGAALPTTYLWGDLIVLSNVLSWSLYMIFSKPLLKRYPPFSLTTYAFLSTAILTLPFSLPAVMQISWSGPTLWGELAYIVLFGTVMTYLFNAIALTMVEASTVAAFILLHPVLASIFAYFILHEAITPIMILEGLLILLGVAVATQPQLFHQKLSSRDHG
jgi:drug/metabolite transporter (DMT)-like permease